MAVDPSSGVKDLLGLLSQPETRKLAFLQQVWRAQTFRSGLPVLMFLRFSGRAF